MTGKEAYRIWAPAGARWTDWVRPVPFVTAGSLSGAYCDPDFHVPAADYVDEHYEDAAVIVDLPGAESVREGIALAKAGYRPVPIYNGTVEQPGSRAATDNRIVGTALIMAAEELAQIRIREDAPPAFLTDSGRMNQFRMEASLFDNSWDVYAQDLPSADYFIKNGIRKVIVIGEKISADLKIILYGFQKKKIKIFLAKPYGIPKRKILHRFFRQEME